MNENELIDIKKKYLFNEEGMIRQGLSMELYAQILMVDSEDELDELIKIKLEEEE